MKSLGVIGGGVLGRAVARGFMEHAEVRVYDQMLECSTHPLAEAATSDIVFICLPTPARSDGTCDTSAICKFLNQARAEQWWNQDSCYVIRSTVPVGFTRQIAEQYFYQTPLFHSPEFLTARCSIVDFQTPARNIIGFPGSEHISLPCDEAMRQKWIDAYARIEALYYERFPGVELLDMESTASELVKLACNSFFASKVTLFNVFNEIAKAAEIDWGDVLEGILSDGRIAHAHTAVPGPDGRQGFGGACLAKDTADLYHCATGLGVDAELLRAVIERNQRGRKDDPGLAKISFPGNEDAG